MRRPLYIWPALLLTAVSVTGCGTSGKPPAKTTTGHPAALAPLRTEEVDKGSVCERTLTQKQQDDLGVWEAEPMSGKGEVSCYFSMTPDEDNAAGYVVTLFENEKALLGNVDGTDPMPTKAVPVTVKGRMAARQVMYGEDWSAGVTVDIGQGRFLYVERYSPGHGVTEKELNTQVVGAAEKVLGNLGSRG
ncbi:hypothetical protein [Streptomyces sp. NPDC042319]|uniref:hypothetical protein n=1 Tax=Streptomyces sp. NPDC042319 TaxID=3154332 RepID=UPI0033E8F856